MTGSPPTVAENGIDFFSELTKAGRDHIRHKDLDKALSLDISRVSWNIRLGAYNSFERLFLLCDPDATIDLLFPVFSTVAKKLNWPV